MAEPEPTAAAEVQVSVPVQPDMLTDRETLELVSVPGSVRLYPEATTKATPVLLRNERTLRLVSELIVLSEVTSPEGKLFYQVRSAFSGDEGYVLAANTYKSKLMASGVSGYAMTQSLGCSILSEPDPRGSVLAVENDHAVRILGEFKDYYFVITERGNSGFINPVQLTLIDQDALDAHLIFHTLPAIAGTMSDPMPDPSAANAAKMLRAGDASASVDYWDTAQSHASSLNRLKKATIAMLSCSAGTGQLPIGREGIQYQSCLEVPPLSEGEELQQGVDFNLHGSIYNRQPADQRERVVYLARQGRVRRRDRHL